MNQRKRIVLFFLICAIPAWLGCGENPSVVRNRIKFLMSKGKNEEALNVALKAAEHSSKSDRGEILLEAATVAVQLYQESGQKSQAQQALEIVQTLIDEKLVVDGRPFFLAAKVFEKDHKPESAIKFFRRAEDFSKSDPQQAGLYRYYLIEMLWKQHDGVQLLKEAKLFRERYPQHDRLSEIERWAADVERFSG